VFEHNRRKALQTATAQWAAAKIAWPRA
jgi:hypothetical protein